MHASGEILLCSVVQCYYFSRQDLSVRMPASIAKISFRNRSKGRAKRGDEGFRY